MDETKTKPTTVDEYIAGFPEPVRSQLQALRGIIHAAVPGLKERVSYGIAAFVLGGKYLVYAGGFREHVSLYPVTGPAREAFEGELDPYLSGKGTAKFAAGTPLPAELITHVVQFIASSRAKAA